MAEYLSSQELVEAWVDAFNQADADKMASLYSENATNHQITQNPVIGRDAIRDVFKNEFAHFHVFCIVEKIVCESDWATLDWVDPSGARGCGFFQFENGLIVFQRGYWDKGAFINTALKTNPTH